MRKWPPILWGAATPPKYSRPPIIKEKRYSQNSNFGKDSGTRGGSAAARGAGPAPCHRASRHGRHTCKCTRNNLLLQEKRSVLCYGTHLTCRCCPPHFSMLFCCSRQGQTPPPPIKSSIPHSLVTPFASPVMKPMPMLTLLQMLGLKLKLHEFLPMLAPILCM